MALQKLYLQASKTLAVATEKAALAPEVAKAKAIDSAKTMAREVLVQAASTGELEKAISEVMRKPEVPKFAAMRDKMRIAFIDALEDGRLQSVLQEQKFEKTCAQARSALINACNSGRLEAAIHEVSMLKQEAARVSPAPLAPSAPPGGPSHRRFQGARAVVPTPSTAPAETAAVQGLCPVPPSEPSRSGSPRKARTTTTATPAPAAPTTARPTSRSGARPTSMLSVAPEGGVVVAPLTPKAPVQPAAAPPGVRRPGRPSLGLSSSEPVQAASAETMGPIRRLPRPCAEAPVASEASAGPTALELDLGGAEEASLRCTKHTASGTGLLPALPSATNSTAFDGWTMGREHNATQQKTDLTAKIRASTIF